jgi:hypothetical protein
MCGTNPPALESFQVGSFLAVRPSYLAEVEESEKQECWVGQVLDVDETDRTVQVQWLDTGCVKNLSSDRASWSALIGEDDSIGWIPHDSILYAFHKLTAAGKMPASARSQAQHRRKKLLAASVTRLSPRRRTPD